MEWKIPLKRYFLGILDSLSDPNMISYLAALPYSVVPLAGKLVQEVRVVVEENIEDILPTYLLNRR